MKKLLLIILITDRLEEIIFTSSEENFYKYGLEVADKLIKEVLTL